MCDRYACHRRDGSGRESARGRWLVLGAVLMCVCGVASCRKSDIRTMRIHVPGMTDEQSTRIAVNAVGYELHRNDANVTASPKEGTITYAAGPGLKSAAVQARLEEALREVGLEGRVTSVQPAPTENWRDRHTVVVEVKEMQNNVAVNRAVHALAHAMRDDNEDVTLDAGTRSLIVEYDSMNMSLKNLEQAIANAGLQANDVPAKLGAGDAVPHGWR